MTGVNGMVVGAVKGALVGSGVGIPQALASDFAAGAVGNALEQIIVNGKVDVGESITSGLTNAVSGAIYGNKPIKNVWGAIGRGAGAGAVTAVINNISEAIGLRNRDSGYYAGGIRMVGRGIGWLEPYGRSWGGVAQGRKKFSFGDFMKDVAVGAVTGGLASAAFYGAGKAVQALKDSVRADKSVSDVWDMKEGGGIINGREYSQHAMERMAPDTPSVRAELSRRAEALAESRGLQVGTSE